MRFIDEAEIEVIAGNGGNGCVAFRREKYRPFGGPSGGDGGKGGDVVFVATSRMGTLLDFQSMRKVSAERGEHGRGKDQYGKGGKDKFLEVPIGTQIFDQDSGELLADLDEEGQSEVIAKGGRGGRGNIHFATPNDRAPRRADPGEEGERRLLRLELKLIADIGLLGFPNVGKSTLIARVSRARPKIADYPFTTLVPNLGVVSLGLDRSFVIADIPGLIGGAAEGHGLGHRFLRHVQRSRLLLHILTLDPDPAREPGRDFTVLSDELRRYDPELAERPILVGLSKIDLPEVREALPEVEALMKEKGHRLYPFSAATGEGLDALLLAMEEALREHKKEEREEEEKKEPWSPI